MTASHHIPIAPNYRRGTTFYDRFDAINRASIRSGDCDSHSCDRTLCDGVGCDSVHLYDASIATPDTTKAAPQTPATTFDPSAKIDLPVFNGPPTPEFVPAASAPDTKILSEQADPNAAPSVLQRPIKKPAKPIRPAPPAKPTRPATPQKLPIQVPSAEEATFDLQTPLASPVARNGRSRTDAKPVRLAQQKPASESTGVPLAESPTRSGDPVVRLSEGTSGSNGGFVRQPSHVR